VKTQFFSLKNEFIKSRTKKNTKKRMSLIDQYQDIERDLENLPMSNNDKHDILHAYKVYFDALNKYNACIRAVETCGLPEEDPEYNNFKDACSEAERAYEIAFNNYDAINDRLVR